MRVKLKQITFFAVFSILISLGGTLHAQTRAYRVSDRQVQNLLNRIENRTDTFKNQVDRALDNSSIDGTAREDSINAFIADFETATNNLKDNFSSRRSAAADVEEVLRRASFINNFTRNNRQSASAQRTWRLLQTDLNTLAGYYRVTPNLNQIPTVGVGRNVYIGTDTQIRGVLRQIENRTDRFKTQVGRNLNNSQIDGTNREDSINFMIENFENATDRLRNNFSARRSTTLDVQEVLNRAVFVNRFVENNRLSAAAERSWTEIRADLNTLARYYRVSSNWNGPVIDNGAIGSLDSRLTGTYRLNRGQSDNVTNVVNREITRANYNVNERDRVRDNLERRLASPETLIFEKRGQQVTMASTISQPVVLDADGVRRSEVLPNGRNVITSITATNNDLTINYEGDPGNDYYVSFVPVNNGQLRVTRRIYLDNRNETVTVMSLYDRTSPTAQFNSNGFPSNTGGNIVNSFIVPNNTGLTATLDAPLSTRTAKNGDRFSMTVTSPSQYNGAIIEGSVIGEQSGVISGKANLSLSFNSIRLRDGRSYRFAGIVEQVRKTDGDIIDINNEGTIRDDSQTTKTITRAGIGAILGGIIGAIAGGGSGAAIGAGVGAGAGAGSVVLQGRDNLELDRGSQFTITSTSPSNFSSR